MSGKSIGDTISLDDVQVLFEWFSKTTGLAVAVVDLQGDVLLTSGWRSICTAFHRMHPEAADQCFLSESKMKQEIRDGKELVFFTCANGLMDAAVPLMLNGEHAANIFAGQFFFEKPDISFFKDMVQKYRFDEQSYLKALEEVPVVSQEDVELAVGHLRSLTQIISGMMLKNSKLSQLNTAIQVSEEKHRRLFDTMTQGVIYQDEKGKVISANPAAEKILGIPFDQMQGKASLNPRWKMITEDGTPVFGDEHPAMKALHTGKPVGPAVRGVFHPKKDAYVWLNITSVPLFHPDHEHPFQVYSTFEDFTKRKHAEEKLKQVLNEYETVFQGTQDAMFFIEVLGPSSFRFIRNNQSHELKTGITLEQIEGRTPQELLGSELGDIVTANFQRCVDAASPVTYEETIDLPGGTIIWNTTLTPIFDEGEIRYIVGSSKDITEQKKAEEEIRRFKTIADNAVYGQAISNLEGTIVYINRFFAEIHGYRPEEVLGSHLHLFHTRDQQKTIAPLITAIREKSSYSASEVWHVHRDGTEFPMLMSGFLLYDDEGNPQYLAASAVDLREYYQVQKNYQLLFDTMQNGVALHEIICDSHGVPTDYRFLSVNPAFEFLTGLKAEEIVGRSVLEVLPDTEKFWIDTYGRVALTGESISFDHYSGALEKHYEVTAFRPFEGRFACIFQDVTEKILSEKSARIRLDLLEYVQDHTLDNLLQKVLQQAELLSGSCISFYHFTAEDQKTILLHTWSERTAGEFCSAGGKGTHYSVDKAGVWADCLRERQPVIHNDYASLKQKKGLPEGHAPIIRELVVPIIRGESILGILGVGNKPENYTSHDKEIISYLADVTWEIIEHKRADEQLREAQVQLIQMQKMDTIGRLAGGIAHDFNNMLGVILGRAEMGIHQVSSNHAVHEDLLEIRKAAERSSELTSQLLAFARKQHVSPKVLSLNEEVTDMIAMLQRLIGADIDLIWRPGNDLWSVMLDPSQVHQILINLCVNAREAVSGTGTITIETKNTELDAEYCAHHEQLIPGEYVMLSVCDNGCGIDKAVLPQLFEPFFTTRKTGTGMGLPTVHGIVKQNLGCIDVNSEQGQGTTITIYLPKHGKKAQEQIHPAFENEEKDASAAILLVDDNPAILSMVTAMLERKGYRIFASESPKEALSIAELNNPPIDVLITDMVMPEMNGRDLADAVLAKCPEIKLLFMSGFTDNPISDADNQKKGIRFMQKPFSMTELTANIQALLKE